MYEKWIGNTGEIHAIGEVEIQLATVESYLHAAHYVESDPMRTHSGVERFWVFEVQEGVALAFWFHDIGSRLYIGSNNLEKLNLAEVSVVFPESYDPISGRLWD